MHGTISASFKVEFCNYNDIECEVGTYGPFTIDLIDECKTATIIPETIDFPTVQYGADLTQTLVVGDFDHDVSVKYADPAICGPISYSLSPVDPFLTLT